MILLKFTAFCVVLFQLTGEIHFSHIMVIQILFNAMYFIFIVCQRIITVQYDGIKTIKTASSCIFEGIDEAVAWKIKHHSSQPLDIKNYKSLNGIIFLIKLENQI
jgi:hypothetical protein